MRLPFQARAVTRRLPPGIRSREAGAGLLPAAPQSSDNSIACPSGTSLCTACGSGKYCCCGGSAQGQCHVDATTGLCVCGAAF
jgi:hypothetical protein